MTDHVTIRVSDYEASRAFYAKRGAEEMRESLDRVLELLGRE
jgi:catechol 2,3-dioxygenase-like lactoylglutathione lyase family enzyme